MHYFASAHPPAPFFIAALSICVQMGFVVLVMLVINYAVESYKGDTWWKSMFKGSEKRTSRSALDLLTRRLIDAHKSCVMIVALNKEAEAELLELISRFKMENFVFCRMDDFPAGEIPEVLSTDTILPAAQDGEIYDIVAIEQAGERWLGFNISEAKKKKLAAPKFELRENVVDCWLMHLLLGGPKFIEAKVTEIPIKWSTL